MKRGFTLVEVMVALTIAAIIALAARAAVVAGIDTEQRLWQHTRVSEGDTRFRALLAGALRHITDSPAPGVAPFAVRDTVVSNVGSQIAEFYSRGLWFPAGTGAILRVVVAPTSDGLTITASRSDGVVVLRGVASGVSGVHVHAKSPAGQWLERWPHTLQVPVAVIADLNAPGGQLPPLVVTTRLEERP